MTCEVKNLSIHVERLPSNVFNLTRRDGSIPFHVLKAFLSENDSPVMHKRITRFQTNIRPVTPSPAGRLRLQARRSTSTQSPRRSPAPAGDPSPLRRRTRSVTEPSGSPLDDGSFIDALRKRPQKAGGGGGAVAKRCRRQRSGRSEAAAAAVSTPGASGEEEEEEAAPAGVGASASASLEMSFRMTRLQRLNRVKRRAEQVKKQIMRRLHSTVNESVNSTIPMETSHDQLASDSSSSKRSTMNSANRSKSDSSSKSDHRHVEELRRRLLVKKKKNKAVALCGNSKRMNRQSGRSPLTPLGCDCPVEEATTSARLRARLPATPRGASSPLDASSTAAAAAADAPCPGPTPGPPRKRRQRFRLLRSKKVEWDESASQTTLDLDQSPLVRSGGKSRLVSCRQLVLDKAKQTQPVCWSDYLSGMAKENFVFLGEGDFAEVYRYSVGKQSVVMKVMAAVDDDQLAAPPEVKGYSHYLPEIVASKMITRLSFKFHNNRTHGFAKLIGINVVKGRLPRILGELKATTDYPTDDRFHHLPANQEWLVLKYPYLGKAMDTIPLVELPAAAMRSIVAQIAISLAAGELVFKFEHRDLHLGNVLLQKVRFDRFRYRVDNENFSVPSEGYLATIIDYTLARVTDEDGEVYFVDFEDDEQDSSEELPEHLSVHFKTKEMNRNRWDIFNPYSNILWLKYISEKFRDALNGLPMGERMRKRNDDVHRAIHSELTVLIDSMTAFRSCAELVRTNFFFDAFRNSGGV